MSTSSDWRGDWWRLSLLLALVVGVRLWMITHTEVVSRDALVFARYAVHLDEPPVHPGTGEPLGSAVGVIRFMSHPPGYPVLLRWCARPFLPEDPKDLGPRLLLVGQYIGLAASVVLVTFGYLLMRRLADRNVALAAMLIYACMPVYVEVSSDAISDGPYLALIVMALWSATLCLDRTTSGGVLVFSLLTGLILGIAYLFRPDTLIALTAIGLTSIAVLIRTWAIGTGRRLAFLRGVAILAGFLLIVTPYVFTIGKLTNKPTGLAIIDSLFGNTPKKTYFERESKAPAAVDIPLGVWYNPQHDGEQSMSLWAAKAVFQETMKSSHYFGIFLFLLAVIVLRHRLTDARWLLLVLTIGVHLTILWVMARGGYVSQRHTLLSIFIICCFSAALLPEIGRLGVKWFPKTIPWLWGSLWLVVMLGVELPRDFRVLHRDRAGHKQAGLWIREHCDPSYRIVDPFGWAEFYAGRSVKNWNHGNANFGSPILYAIIEPNAKSPHSRLDNLAPAMKLKEAGKRVYQWPEDVPESQVRVAVYESKPVP